MTTTRAIRIALAMLPGCLWGGATVSPNAIFLNPTLDADKVADQKGDIHAPLRLGYRHLIGSADAFDAMQAYTYFSKAARTSLAGSAFLGYAGLSVPELAQVGGNAGLALVRQAANAGDPVGTVLLGRLYHLGIGVPKDVATARKLYLAGAPRFALAARFLGELDLESGPAQRSEALGWLLVAAAANETRSMADLGTMYMRGIVVKKDYKKAADWLYKGQKLGDPVACYQRATLYRKGWGVQKSNRMAALLFQRSANTGYPPAQAALGMCYASGAGVEKDLKQAIYWLTLAAPNNAYAAQQLARLQGGR